MATFKIPTQKECYEAVGIIQAKQDVRRFNEDDHSLLYTEPYEKEGIEVNKEFIRALVPDEDMFDHIRQPDPQDWLASQHEKGQTFQQFLLRSRNVPDKHRHTIYILPLTFFEDAVPSEILEALRQFASIFFGLPVKIAEPTSFHDGIASRTNEFTHKKQVHAQEILAKMIQILPEDAYCLAAVTLCDLYPRDSWNFVFGLANLSNRVGVYSLCRHIPSFPNAHQSMKGMTSAEKSTLLVRACKLMCHEISHMFGIRHCIFYNCLMNGSMHAEESDSRPLHLCPVCLRKLHFSCKFEIQERYEAMMAFTESRHMSGSDWFRKRLQQLQ